MNSKERVKTALELKEPDRIPLDIGGTRVSGIHIGAYHLFRQFYGLPQIKPEIFVRYLQLAKIEEDFRNFLKVDLESINPNSLAEDGEIEDRENGKYYLDRWNCGWYMPEGGNYFDLKDFPLAEAKEVKDILGCHLPDPCSEIMFKDFIEDAIKINNERKRAIVLSRDCAGIFEMAMFLRGHEKFMLDLAMDTKSVEALLDKILEYKLAYWQKAIEKIMCANCDYFIITESDDLGSQNGLLISPEMYRHFIKPRHTQLFNAIKKWSQGRAYIELHCCGSIREIIPDFIESGVKILNPVQVSAVNMDTAELKKEFGDSIVFHGGGLDSQHTLPYGTAAEVKDEVKRRIEDLAPGGGFIFTPVHSIQSGVPPENFAAMMETFYSYASY